MTDLRYRLRHEATSKEAGMLEQGSHASDRYQLLMEAEAEIERLTALKTPASRALLNISKGCLDYANAEIERLQAELDYWKDLVPKQVRQNFPYRALEPKP